MLVFDLMSLSLEYLNGCGSFISAMQCAYVKRLLDIVDVHTYSNPHFLYCVLKPESCHDAYFVVTGGTSDDKVGIITTLGFQCVWHIGCGAYSSNV